MEEADMYTPRELVGLFPPTFDQDYIDGAVVPYLLSGTYVGERPALPLIDLSLSKENAIPPHLWGRLYDGWAPNPKEGVSVFIKATSSADRTTSGRRSTSPRPRRTSTPPSTPTRSAAS